MTQDNRNQSSVSEYSVESTNAPEWLDFEVDLNWEPAILTFGVKKPSTIKLGKVQCGVGIILGKIVHLNDLKTGGTIVVGGHEFPFKFENPKYWRRWIGNLWNQESWYTIWPNWKYIPNSLTDGSERLPELRLARPRRNGEQGIVEIIGRVKRVFPEGIVISIWSRTKQRFFSVFILGNNQTRPRDFVRVIARLDLEHSILKCESIEKLKVHFPEPEKKEPPPPPPVEETPKPLRPTYKDQFQNTESLLKTVGLVESENPHAFIIQLNDWESGKVVGTATVTKEALPSAKKTDLIEFVLTEMDGNTTTNTLRATVREHTEALLTLALAVSKNPSSAAGKFCGTLKMPYTEALKNIRKDQKYLIRYEKTELKPVESPKKVNPKEERKELVNTPGKAELVVKINQIPDNEILKDKQRRFRVEHEGNIIEIVVKEKVFKKLLDANATAKFGWVAAITGKMKIAGGIVLMLEPNMQIFEKKEPKKVEANASQPAVETAIQGKTA